MNDRFKFRAKRCDNGEFVFGYLNFIYVDKPEKARIYCQDDTRSYDVITKTLGQCTGLKDKNGTLIYEGDIITVGNGSINGRVVTSNWEVVWEDKNGKYRVPPWISDKPDFSHFVVVIGNIHENPELMEDK